MLCCVMGLVFTFFAQAQDHHFSQFDSSPLYLNPALTGSINGKARIIANHRNQWPQLLQSDSYKTYALSYDRRKNLKSGDAFGIGLAYFRDVAGSVRFKTEHLSINFSYAKTILKSGTSSHRILAGLQLGLVQRSIERNSLRWSTQMDLNNPIMRDYVGQPDFLYFDISGGLVWMSRFGDRKNFHVGIGTSHLNRPNISFQNNLIVSLSIKTSIHAGAELPLSSRLSILPKILYQRQGIHSQFNLGTMFRLSSLSSNIVSNIQGGFFYRAGQDVDGGIHSDAIISVFTVQLKGIQLGFSYDATISKLNVSTLGAFELSLGYIFKKTDQGVSPYEMPLF